MKLEKIDKGIAKSGVPFFKLTIDAKNYNYFGDLGDIKEGDSVLCEFETKGQYTNLKKISGSSPVRMENQAITARHDVVLSRTEKPHSYEFGKATSRHKVYYNDVAELKQHIEALKESGLYEDEIQTIKI